MEIKGFDSPDFNEDFSNFNYLEELRELLGDFKYELKSFDLKKTNLWT